MRSIRVKTLEFEAVDSDGNSVKIFGYHESIDVTLTTGESAEALSSIGELEDEDGNDVTYIDKGVYNILRGVDFIRVTSTDPRAL